MRALPDLRSFPMKGGVDYGHGELDRAERDYQNKQDDIRSNADPEEIEEDEAGANGMDREVEFDCDEEEEE